MFADRKNSFSSGNHSKKRHDRGYFGYSSGEPRSNMLSGKIARDNLNLRSGVRIFPDAGAYSRDQSLSAMRIHHQHGRPHQVPSTYTTFTRSHTFLPQRCANKKGCAHGFRMNESCMSSFRGQHCEDAFKGPDMLIGKGFLYNGSVKWQKQKQIEHVRQKPLQKLELLGHTEEKMRDLILSKATRTPFRYFNFDVELSNSRLTSAGRTLRNLGVISPTAEHKFPTKYNNQVLEKVGHFI